MIPFLDLRAQYHSIKREIDEAVLNLIESTKYILGDEVDAFEKEFAAYCNSSHGIGVNSGTSALHLALLAAGIGPGDEVITVPNTFIATVAAIYYTGARPVLVDIDPRSYTMDPSKLDGAITKRTKAIIPVHLYGQPADMDPILEIAAQRNLVVIEDACQAHGAEYKGKRAGSLGAMGCFSFYPGKNLGAYGEGGMVVTNNSEYARTIRMYRDWGQEHKHHHVLKGYNYRLEGIQGAILRVKLRHLDDWTKARRARAVEYNKLLKDSGAVTPEEMPYSKHVYHIYAVRSRQRDSLQAKLQEKGVQTAIHYPVSAHLTPAYSDLGYGKGDFPHAEAAASEVLSLPMYPEISAQQVEEVAAGVTDSLKGMAQT